jgi:UDP-N-acetylglucosamine 2-epimerase (non-hydrolysing)
MKKSKHDVFIYGTRPEHIKFSPLLEFINPFLLFTGQQIDLIQDSAVSFDCNLYHSVHSGQSLSSYLGSLIQRIDDEIKILQPKRIWVQGDTTSAYAGALVARLNKIELIHLEAGLRTYNTNNPYPEENYRRMIDSISDILFAPTKTAVENLQNEKVQGKIHLVGNTIVDALEKVKKDSGIFRPISKKYVLATVHRRESFGNDMIEIFKALKRLSKDIKVIIPLHSNPKVKEAIKQVGLQTVKPMSYPEFLRYLKFSEYVLSDSGGVQEEAPSFGKKIIVLRKTTERPEIIERGYGILIKKMRADCIYKQIKDFSKLEITKMANPFGDGHAAEKIVEIINDMK